MNTFIEYFAPCFGTVAGLGLGFLVVIGAAKLMFRAFGEA